MQAGPCGTTPLPQTTNYCPSRPHIPDSRHDLPDRLLLESHSRVRWRRGWRVTEGTNGWSPGLEISGGAKSWPRPVRSRQRASVLGLRQARVLEHPDGTCRGMDSRGAACDRRRVAGRSRVGDFAPHGTDCPDGAEAKRLLVIRRRVSLARETPAFSPSHPARILRCA